MSFLMIDSGNARRYNEIYDQSLIYSIITALCNDVIQFDNYLKIKYSVTNLLESEIKTEVV
jgi:hypothetical protein